MQGTYEISLDESSSKGYRAGTIVFDLKSKSPDVSGKDKKFKGAYFIESSMNSITLWPADGDNFYQERDEYKYLVICWQQIELWNR